MEVQDGFQIRKPFLCVIFLFISGLAFCQDIFGTDTRTYVIMPAEAVSSGITKDPEVSESGRWIIYQRQMISTAENLIAKLGKEEFVWFGYDRETKANNRLGLPKTASHIVVMGDNQTIYFEDEATDKASFYNIKSGMTTPVPTAEGFQARYFGEKDFAPFLLFQKDGQSVIVYPNGKQSSFTYEPSLAVEYPFGSDAQNLYFLGTITNSKPTKVGRVSVNRQTGQVSFQEWDQDQIDKHFEAILIEEEIFSFEFQANATYLFLSDSEKPNKTIVPRSGKLCSTHDILLNQKHALVMYQESGALLIREIKKIDPSLAVKGVADSLREKVMQEAKQTALAFLLFANDYDDVMPGQERWQEDVLPYSKDREMLKKFTYTFRGGDISKLDGSKVELGFTMGLGGRAVAYLDGSVKWIQTP